MDPKIFQANAPGKLVDIGNREKAFVPAKLPPDITITPEIALALEEANHQLGALDGLGRSIQDPNLLVLPFMRREAVLSSKIEGTIASVSDLVLFEADPTRQRGDEREVQNYVEALQYGLKQIKSIPLGRRLMCDMHERLMSGVSGERYASPGAIRKSQVYVGRRVGGSISARFVPPPAPLVPDLISGLDSYMNEQRLKLPLLIRIALIHYQFEVIHPFYDGNGRIGRLLIMLLLGINERLTQPLLYPSAFFSENKTEYYDQLLSVSTSASWENWILFFLRAIAESSSDAVRRAQRIVKLHRVYRNMMVERHAGDVAQRLLDLLFSHPGLTITYAAKRLKTTYPTVQKGVNKLIEADILSHQPGTSHPKVYVAWPIVRAIER